MRNITETVKQIIIINIIFFIGTNLVGDIANKYFSLYFPLNNDFQFWQLITYMFMHFDIMHIFFNMFVLYSFGSLLEHFWGGKKFLFFYISCGLGAALLHLGINYYHFENGIQILNENGFNTADILAILQEGKIDTRWQELLTVTEFNNFTSAFLSTNMGASGAVYGVMVAFAFMFPEAELFLMFIPIPIKAKYFVPVLVFIDLYLGASGTSLSNSGPGIAHFAHVGGALVGFLMMWFWKKNQNHNH